MIQPVKLSFRYDGKVKAFWGNWKLREFTTTGSAVQEMLEGALQTYMKKHKCTNFN